MEDRLYCRLGSQVDELLLSQNILVLLNPAQTAPNGDHLHDSAIAQQALSVEANSAKVESLS